MDPPTPDSKTPLTPAAAQRLVTYELDPKDLLYCALVTAGRRFPTLQFLASKVLCQKPGMLRISLWTSYRLWTYLAWNVNLRTLVKPSGYTFRIELMSQQIPVGVITMAGHRKKFLPSSWLLSTPAHSKIDKLWYNFGMYLYDIGDGDGPQRFWCQKNVVCKRYEHEIRTSNAEISSLIQLEKTKQPRVFSRPTWMPPLRPGEM